MSKASSSRLVGNPAIFDSDDPAAWEAMYTEIMEAKYSKNTRNFSRKITAPKWAGDSEDDCTEGDPPIFIIPRVRGGASYKSVPLKASPEGRFLSADEIAYCPISKGFSMQDVSSFTLGPIVGEGLCLVNAAFSKAICIMHIEGGGTFDLKRKNFWKSARKPHRVVKVLGSHHISVDDVPHNTVNWLNENEDLWREQWDKWRKAIALCSRGDFHWTDSSETVMFFSPNMMAGRGEKGAYLSFPEWKKECYIRPSYELLEATPVMQFLRHVWQTKKRPLGLVHPKGMKNEAETPITPDFIRELFDSPDEMCCQPYVVVGKLLGVPIDT